MMFRTPHFLLLLALVGCGNASDDTSPDLPTAGSSPVADETGEDTGGPVNPGMRPDAPAFTLSFSPVKQLELSWSVVEGATSHQVFERADPTEEFVQLGPDIGGTSVSVMYTLPLHLRVESSYLLSACNAQGCTDSDPVAVTEMIVDAVGYIKGSNTGSQDGFGAAIAISDDGTTLAVGAPFEDGSAREVDGANDDEADDVGAVYILARDDEGRWTQQAYIKPSNGDDDDHFGDSVALSANGNVLAVSATGEDAAAGDPASSGAADSGAVYVFVRDNAQAWSEQAYIKASNPGEDDEFGLAVSLSNNGEMLAVGAPGEDGDGSEVGAPQNDETPNAGAVYLYRRSGTTWGQEIYIKASNPDPADFFGSSVALSGDGRTLAAGATFEDGSSPGIDGYGGNDGATSGSGAAYVFSDGSGTWAQQAYVKASNPGFTDQFGVSVALSDDGNVLAVGSDREDGSAVGVGNGEDDDAPSSGAVYMYDRNSNGWAPTTYIKASNTGINDNFGHAIALSSDGSMLAVGAPSENSDVIGLDAGDGGVDDEASDSGAVYVFTNDGAVWSQRSYVKAPNTDANDSFGLAVDLSDEGSTLAVGADGEDSEATGIDGNQAGDAAQGSGAAYLY
ncbi:MAG: integrin [Myxococcota bacterium]